MEYAALRLLAGDRAGYNQLCARLVERYGDNSDLDVAERLSRICTMAPGAVDDPARPLAWSVQVNPLRGGKRRLERGETSVA